MEEIISSLNALRTVGLLSRKHLHLQRSRINRDCDHPRPLRLRTFLSVDLTVGSRCCIRLLALAILYA
ncbi:hypothetical protein P153DRAFT_364754 [Dothidotthia symphoricarpi CBS 119687]|uniref:Uncharacterized protein n=1 Tax=Dothidotthia symphoricarpi CBS 119687 TaxID=1392245 RepID=A0A6A6AME9_9PLEO|nr:uncharacterized protein P153DRAFT_364754 [Dothidotthia symphoricarpi CBS 119687]KAF2132343.1 hypothetical protein P153DRAFT_364754 [Dothidotthia symphoricarpi CBS 119687]